MTRKGDIVRYTAEELAAMRQRGESRTDWAKVDAMTEEELEASIAADPDDIQEQIDWTKVIKGLPPLKKHINIRVDSDVLDWFRATGKGYQTRRRLLMVIALLVLMGALFELMPPVLVRWIVDEHLAIGKSEGLLALGFLGPEKPLLASLGLERDPHGNIRADDFVTSAPGIFTAGDARVGASLIVTAIDEGRKCAEAVNHYLHNRGASPRYPKDPGRNGRA